MSTHVSESGALIVTVRGRVTKIKKQSESKMARGSNGVYMRVGDSDGTHLYVHVTVYESAEYEFEGKKYTTPKKFVLDCYDSVRAAIGVQVGKNLALKDKQMRWLDENFVGKKVDIVMSIPQTPVRDAYGDLQAYVAIADLIVGKTPVLNGKVHLEEVQ